MIILRNIGIIYVNHFRKKYKSTNFILCYSLFVIHNKDSTSLAVINLITKFY